MTKLRSKGLTGAMLVAVLMAGSLRGLEAGAEQAVVWETRSQAAGTSVTGGQGVGFWGCAGCVAGGLATLVLSGGVAAVTLIACGVLCSMAFADDV